MNRIARTLVVFALALACASSAFAQKGEFVEAKDGEYIKFPVLPSTRSLTDSEIVNMKLRLIELDHNVEVLNHYRDLRDAKGRHVYETLTKGTRVFVDEFNNVRYKRDCANRITEGTFVAVNRKPAQPNVATGGGQRMQVQLDSQKPPATDTAPAKGFWVKTKDHILSELLFIWDMAKWLSGILCGIAVDIALGIVIIAILTLLGWIIWMLVSAIRDLGREIFSSSSAPASAPSTTATKQPVVASVSPVPPAEDYVIAEEVLASSAPRQTTGSSCRPHIEWSAPSQDKPQYQVRIRGLKAFEYRTEKDGAHLLRFTPE